MTLQITYNKRRDFTYINFNDISKIEEFGGNKTEFVIITKKEYEKLKKDLEYLLKNPKLF